MLIEIIRPVILLFCYSFLVQQTCRQCQQSFEITPADLAFYDKVSPVFNGKKEPIPPPTLCPDCRQQRRLAFRNAHVLYKRSCDLTGQKILSTASPDKPHTIYNQHDWWSDAWEPMKYGFDFEFSRPCFEQLLELQLSVPRLSLGNFNSINSEYVAIGGDNKNCYLASPCFQSEDCYFGDSIYSCKNTNDCLLCESMEISYECINCKNGYNLFFSQNCINCHDSLFLKDCNNCSECIGCFGLKNQRFFVFNQQVNEAEFQAIRARLAVPLTHGTIANMRGKLQETERKLPHVCMRQTMSENCTGNEFIECRNCGLSYDLKRCEDVKFCFRVFDAKNSYDLSKCGITGLELCYELMNAGYGSSHVLFCHASKSAMDAYYCEHCYSCSDCFGCIGLRHKHHCILNKQYTKEEYNDLVPKIIAKMRADGEWGEFFPVTMSPFAYNETVAQEYFPLTKEEVLERGWKWRDQTDELPKVEKIIPAAQLPDSIDDIPGDILNWAIECEATKRPFKIIKQELEFYRQMRLPVPRFHPDERHRRRMALRNPRKLWNRQCAKCQQPIATSYSPERPEIVYCESCYLAAVY